MPVLYGTLRPFRDEELKKIHDSTLRVLEKTGILLNSDEVLGRLEATEARIDYDTKIVKFPSSMVEEALFRCRNLADRKLAGENLIFSCDGGGGYLYDYTTSERRIANLSDLVNACRLVDALENIDEVSFPVWPQEVPYKIIDLVIWKTVWTYTRKEGGGGLSRNGNAWLNMHPKSIDYLLRLAAVKVGGMKRLKEKPVIGGFVGSSSPLRYDETVLTQMLKLAEEHQYIGIGSNVIGGVQSPPGIAALATMENAERLGGLTMVMNIDPSAHVYFTNHPNYLDMVAGNVANGSPEHALAAFLGQALLRYYGLNLFVSHPAVLSGSHLLDEQTGIEKTAAMLLAGLGGTKGICSCGSINESFSFEQLVIDNEIAGLVKHYLKGIKILEEDIALDVIEEVGVGGNFLEHPTTAARVRQTYWQPAIFSRQSYASWLREDGKDIAERAHRRVEKILSSPAAIYLTENQQKEMDEIIKEAQNKLPEQGKQVIR